MIAPRRVRVAVLGGSFDPPHLGHLAAPGWILGRGMADEVWLVPSFAHAFGKGQFSFERRMRWLEQAVQEMGYDRRVVRVVGIESDLGASKEGPVYALDMLRALRAQHPSHDFRLVVGQDIVESGETARWHEWAAVEAEFAPIVMPRATQATPGPLPEISSTQLREAHEKGQLERYRDLMPRVVYEELQGEAGARPRVLLVGQGNVASRLLPWLRGRGLDVRSLGARALLADPQGLLAEHLDMAGEEPVDCAIWLCCRDGDIPGLAERLADPALALPVGIPVFHAAGARSAEELLAPLAKAGHPVGTLHPIFSLRRENPTVALEDAHWGVELSEGAQPWAGRLLGTAPRLQLKGLSAEERVTYHAACALVANHLAVLLDAGAQAHRALGIDEAKAEAALAHLLVSSAQNLAAAGIPGGITGPLSRGDTQAVRAHLKRLGALEGSAAQLYRDLSEALGRLLERSR